MDYRSGNPEGYVHFGGDIMSGANSTRGVLLSSNTIQAVSDNAAEDLILRAKGTGKVLFGTSTSGLGGIVRGTSTTTPPPLAISAIGESTMAVAGLSTADSILVEQSPTLSTAYGMVGYYISAANEVTIRYLNNLASTQSQVGGVTNRWTIFKA